MSLTFARFLRVALATVGFGLLTVSLVGCGGCGSDNTVVEPVYDVSPTNLVRLYRDSPQLADATYTGRKIRVRFGAKQYRVVAGAIGHPPVGLGWFTGFVDVPPVLVFRCIPPSDDTQPIEVVGVCRGLIHDGIRRGSGIEFHIRVEDCIVSVQSPVESRSP